MMFAALRRNLFFGVFPDGVTQVQVIIADALRIVHNGLAERRLLIERTAGDESSSSRAQDQKTMKAVLSGH
jgi:hypothetical protein